MQKELPTYKLTFLLCLFIFMCSSFLLHTQTDKNVKMITTAASLGYSWQGTHNMDLGLGAKLLLDAKRDHSNVSLIISGNVVYYKQAVYLTPTTKVRIMPHKRKKTRHLAWFASLGHSYTQILGRYDHRITPELGIKWEIYNLSAGYNIPVSNYRDPCTNLLRIAFSLNLF